MRQSIATKYQGPTDYRGARVIARSATGHRLTVAWNYALDPAGNHAEAARALAAKLGWMGEWYGGSTPTGYVFVTGKGSTFIL